MAEETTGEHRDVEEASLRLGDDKVKCAFAICAASRELAAVGIRPCSECPPPAQKPGKERSTIARTVRVAPWRTSEQMQSLPGFAPGPTLFPMPTGNDLFPDQSC